MPLRTILVNGHGEEVEVKVTPEGNLNTVIHPHPPQGETLVANPFRQYFTDDGTSSGSNDMRVDGSTNNVEFSIKAIPDYDLHIKTLSVLIADAGATLGEFANLAALTNGIEFCWVSQDVGAIVIADSIKTNYEFLRLSLGKPTLDVAANVVGAADAFSPSIDLSETFGLPWGIKLRKNTQDKLIFKVRDDLSTGITQFDIIGYGVKF